MNLISLEIYGTKRRLFSKFYARLTNSLVEKLDGKIEWENLFIFFPRENWGFDLDGYIKVKLSALSEAFENYTLETSRMFLEKTVLNTLLESFPKAKKIIVQYGEMPCRVLYEDSTEE